MCVMAKRWRDVCTGQKANALARRTHIHFIVAAGVSRLKLPPPAGIMSGLTSVAAKIIAFVGRVAGNRIVFKRSHKVILALTVQEILDEHIVKKLV